MKFGVLYHRDNMNIGDDIQAYAISCHLPSIDYYVDREHIHEFKTDENEPVAVIMSGWYMWRKWNWPPSRYIVPHMVGFHYTDHELAGAAASPLKFEALEGIGGEYLKGYEPIGCRDLFTLEKLKGMGIDAYFSGCITLTLPQMPERPKKKEYVCLVDLDKSVKERLLEILQETEYEVKIMTHIRKKDPLLSWEGRKRIVEDLLTTYRNAKYVITKRLHCALPCLAQGTPVLFIKDDKYNTRFDPYRDWLHWITVKDFLNGDYTYDFNNPLPNKPNYLATRDSLTKSVTDFVQAMMTETRSTEELNRLAHTDEEIQQWRYQLMNHALELWLSQEKKNHSLLVKLQQENKKLTTDLKSTNKRIQDLNKSPQGADHLPDEKIMQEEKNGMSIWKRLKQRFTRNSSDI